MSVAFISLRVFWTVTAAFRFERDWDAQSPVGIEAPKSSAIGDRDRKRGSVFLMASLGALSFVLWFRYLVTPMMQLYDKNRCSERGTLWDCMPAYLKAIGCLIMALDDIFVLYGLWRVRLSCISVGVGSDSCILQAEKMLRLTDTQSRQGSGIEGLGAAQAVLDAIFDAMWSTSKLGIRCASYEPTTGILRHCWTAEKVTPAGQGGQD